MRKERQKARKSDRQLGQPKRKRQKMDQEQSIAVENMFQEMRRGEKRRKKQQSLEECLEQARHKRMRKDVCMLQLPSQEMLVCSSGGPSHHHGEGAPLKQINTRACGDKCQAELQYSTRENVRVEQQCSLIYKIDQAEHCNNATTSSSNRQDERDQAEHDVSPAANRAEQMCTQPDDENCSFNNISSSSSKTHSTKQSPTKPGAVARYDISPVRNFYVPKLTNPKLGNPPRDDNCQAGHQCSLIEGQDRAEHLSSGGDGHVQAEQMST